MVFDEAPDIPPEYAFDVNAVAGEEFWQRPTGTTISQYTQNDDLPFTNGSIQQDFNNNDGISFDDVEFENGHDNGNDIMTNRIQISKGEYAYKVFSNIRNFWAGPSYWKFSKNLNKSNQVPDGTVNRSGRRKRKQPMKPAFDDGDETSSDEYFIKINSKATKKLRHLNRALWNSAQLKLPPQCDVPKDLFAKHNYNRHSNTSTDSIESNQEQNYNADGNGFGVSSHVHCMLSIENYSKHNFYLFYSSRVVIYR